MATMRRQWEFRQEYNTREESYRTESSKFSRGFPQVFSWYRSAQAHNKITNLEKNIWKKTSEKFSKLIQGAGIVYVHSVRLGKPQNAKDIIQILRKKFLNGSTKSKHIIKNKNANHWLWKICVKHQSNKQLLYLVYNKCLQQK